MSSNVVSILGDVSYYAKLVAEYGLPAVKKTMEALSVETVTAEDVEKLKSAIKSPEEYGN